MSFLERFDVDFAPKLNHRAAGFRSMFAALGDKAHPFIVETGCLRDIDNWAGDGQSTLLFGSYAATLPGGRVITIDVSKESCAAAREACAGLPVEVLHGDSVRTLSMFSSRRPADLLYLDSLDFDGNKPLTSALHHMWELAAARHLLESGSIVAVDDMGKRDGKPFGKGMLVADFMKRVGAEQFLDAYQMAWRMP